VLTDLATRFAARFKGDPDPEMRSLGNPARLSRHLQARTVDVNNDGRPEYLVNGMPPFLCGAQNCSYWLYHRAPSGRYRLLLDDELFLWMEVLSTSSQGYRDVLGVMHWGWQERFHIKFSAANPRE
jgi:hypothetical protein